VSTLPEPLDSFFSEASSHFRVIVYGHGRLFIELFSKPGDALYFTYRCLVCDNVRIGLSVVLDRALVNMGCMV